MHSLLSGDTMTYHLGNAGCKQMIAKTGSYKVTYIVTSVTLPSHVNILHLILCFVQSTTTSELSAYFLLVHT